MSIDQPNQEAVIVTKAEKARAREVLRSHLENAEGYIAYDMRVIIDDIPEAEEHDPGGVVFATLAAMLSYADEAVRAERERAARIADEEWSAGRAAERTETTESGRSWRRGRAAAGQSIGMLIRGSSIRNPDTTGDPA